MVSKSYFRTVIMITIASFLAGCGTFVPKLREVGDEAIYVQAIVASIHCDVAKAAYSAINIARRAPRLHPVAKEWYDHWGAEIALTLAIDDKTTVAPNAVGMPPSPADLVFTVGATASASVDAVRTDKVNYFYTMRDLYDRVPCSTGVQPRDGAPSPIVQDDLGTANWLNDLLAPLGTQEVNLETSASGVSKQNVLSHEVKFVVATSGGLTPGFKLTRALVNSSGPFLSSSRDRTSDLIVTFGPLDPKQKNGQLIPVAESIHQVQQFGLANNIDRPTYNFSLFGR